MLTVWVLDLGTVFCAGSAELGYVGFVLLSGEGNHIRRLAAVHLKVPAGKLVIWHFTTILSEVQLSVCAVSCVLVRRDATVSRRHSAGAPGHDCRGGCRCHWGIPPCSLADFDMTCPVISAGGSGGSDPWELV
ncbi:hypothetical protein F4778DRAFT_713337 [Xylariomycetidae sp. FL2044]|nr:hypothetical protein F4778DRAFT_713337 [Xylariomycetidae sp. FL2044]